MPGAARGQHLRLKDSLRSMEMNETAKTAASQPLVNIAVLVEFIARALVAAGIPAEDARQVAALMAEADARGGDAHGVFRLRAICEADPERRGQSAAQHTSIVSEKAGTALVDGDNALGHLVMKRATELAMEKARQGGVGWVGTRRSNHAGPAQLYPRMAAAQDMIGIVFLRRQCQSIASVGRYRGAAQHQSYRHRCAGLATSRHFAGHGHDEHCVRENPAESATRTSRCRKAG